MAWHTVPFYEEKKIVCFVKRNNQKVNYIFGICFWRANGNYYFIQKKKLNVLVRGYKYDVNDDWRGASDVPFQ